MTVKPKYVIFSHPKKCVCVGGGGGGIRYTVPITAKSEYVCVLGGGGGHVPPVNPPNDAHELVVVAYIR